MLIRNLEPSDLATVHTINQDEVPAVGDATLDHLAHIADMSAIKLVAVQASKDPANTESDIAGFCLVLAPGTSYQSGNYRWFSERYDDFLYLDRVAIAPRYQRRGIGRALYQAVIERAPVTRPGAAFLTLEVNLEPRNDNSLAFHAALGFVEVGQRVTDYGTRVSLLALPLALPVDGSTNGAPGAH